MSSGQKAMADNHGLPVLPPCSKRSASASRAAAERSVTYTGQADPVHPLLPGHAREAGGEQVGGKEGDTTEDDGHEDLGVVVGAEPEACDEVGGDAGAQRREQPAQPGGAGAEGAHAVVETCRASSTLKSTTSR